MPPFHSPLHHHPLPPPTHSLHILQLPPPNASPISSTTPPTSGHPPWPPPPPSSSLPLLLCAAALSPATAADADGFTTFKGGTSPTAIRIAQAPSSNSSSTFFGAVVGRAQGTYTFADQKTFGLLMVMNFVFTAGDHNGSSLSILGRNEVLDDIREMSFEQSSIIRFPDPI
ncbi:hypothetical protein HU200_000606 [Digitaria exilis]|uniref:Dirigent protein n=1 Tax=Digitaria exilis TaxID=1010633 RepID=A0A835FYK9_9POAL|nr:hypothetical protein HU200_000606 [Digitaria exilis]